MTIKLLLADDHAMVRKGLQVFLSTQPDLELVGEASNGAEVLEKAALLSPDIILMDLQMPVLDGVETTKRLKESQPSVRVIVLTSFSDQAHVVTAIRAGAKGYLMKDVEPEDLVRAIRSVHQGKIELHPEAACQLVNLVSAPEPALLTQPPSPSPFAELTKREREVLRLLASGKSNKEIGNELFITEKTVKTHVSHVLDKLGLTDRTQAAVFAVKQGFEI